ncbi:hypothetical protein [Stenotrophomonas maltophilia]|uniref:hypothetical protein n=1 Tax=Stenotrophomonas maltophilia TaxID=40324 RepID=UPI0034DB1F03
MHSFNLLYTYVIILLASLPLIGAYVARERAWLEMNCLVVLALSGFPGAIRQARRPIVRATQDPNRSYARSPGASTTHAAANLGQGNDAPGASP